MSDPLIQDPPSPGIPRTLSRIRRALAEQSRQVHRSSRRNQVAQGLLTHLQSQYGCTQTLFTNAQCRTLSNMAPPEGYKSRRHGFDPPARGDAFSRVECARCAGCTRPHHVGQFHETNTWRVAMGGTTLRALRRKRRCSVCPLHCGHTQGVHSGPVPDMWGPVDLDTDATHDARRPTRRECEHGSGNNCGAVTEEQRELVFAYRDRRRLPVAPAPAQR